MSTSRQSRLYLSAKMVSLIRSNDESGTFSAQELLHIESLLRDELMTNQWLFNVCNAISDDSVFVTKEECDLFDKHQNEDQSISVSITQVKELQNKLKFYKEKALSFKYIYNDLNKKLTEIRKNDSKTDEQEINNQAIRSNLNIKLQESLALLKSDLSSHLDINDPKDIVEEIMTRLNENAIPNDGDNSLANWLNQKLDELALSHINKRELLKTFNSELVLRLENLKRSLMELYKECHRIKDFYDINIKEEMSWREDLKQILNQIQETGGTQKTLVPQIFSEPNDLNAKKELIQSYSQLFDEIESQEFDQFEPLMNALKERIETLQNL